MCTPMGQHTVVLAHVGFICLFVVPLCRTYDMKGFLNITFSLWLNAVGKVVAITRTTNNRQYDVVPFSRGTCGRLGYRIITTCLRFTAVGIRVTIARSPNIVPMGRGTFSGMGFVNITICLWLIAMGMMQNMMNLNNTRRSFMR